MKEKKPDDPVSKTGAKITLVTDKMDLIMNSIKAQCPPREEDDDLGCYPSYHCSPDHEKDIKCFPDYYANPDEGNQYCEPNY